MTTPFPSPTTALWTALALAAVTTSAGACESGRDALRERLSRQRSVVGSCRVPRALPAVARLVAAPAPPPAVAAKPAPAPAAPASAPAAAATPVPSAAPAASTATATTTATATAVNN